MPKRLVKGALRINAYAVLERAVEEGVRYGLRRAHKHTESPSQEDIEENVSREVMTTLSEVFVFEGGS